VRIGLRSYKVLLTALLAGCFFIVSCENDEKKIDLLLKKKTGIEEALKVETLYSQSGKLKAKLNSPYMLRYLVDSPYIEFPRTLYVEFFNDSGKVESVLTARYAKYRENERKVFLRDSVRVINIIHHDTLLTSELWWDQEKQEFFTDKPVEVRQPDKTMFPQSGLRAKQDLSEYYFYNNKGTIVMPKEGLPE
jgi:LPS export ABC transporter protein LptC